MSATAAIFWIAIRTAGSTFASLVAPDVVFIDELVAVLNANWRAISH